MDRDQDIPRKLLDRRRLMKLAGAGAVGAALGVHRGPLSPDAAQPIVLAQEEEDEFEWDEEFDVIVAGSGGAGSAAAVTAAETGASVVVLEKSDMWGGATAHSGGGSFVPNNEKMQEAGIEDSIEATIRYICRVAFPTHYDPDAENYGLPDVQFSAIETYATEASDIFAWFEDIGALRTYLDPDYPLYYGAIPEAEGLALSGQLLFPIDDDDNPGSGGEMIRQFLVALEERGVDTRSEHRVERLVMNEDGRALGVEVTNGEGETLHISARGGVIFGTGGFANNAEMNFAYLRGPVFGGGAPASNQGDFVFIAGAAGAQFSNMQHAWLAEAVLDQAVELPGRIPTIIQPPGDSMIYVNRFGHRVVDEKMQYQDRPHIHFHWDPIRAEYTNLVLFKIYDQRAADEYAGAFPIPAPDGDDNYVVTGETLEELADNIDAKLAEYSAHTGNLRLHEHFAQNLGGTIGAFNQFAETGVDRHFHRGETPIEIHNHAMFSSFAVGDTEHDFPNPTMHPISEEGPYYAVLVVASSFDTKGGALTNSDGQVRDQDGNPIPGLYAAGNCSSSPVGQAYPGPGATLGPALTFGYKAGMSAVADLDLEDDDEPEPDDDEEPDDEEEPDDDDDDDDPDPDDDDPDDDDDEVAEPQEHVVEAGDNYFEPQDLTIAAGDTVRFVNVGQMAHTATCDPDRAFDEDNIALPDGAETWDSGMFDPGEEWSVTLTVPGEYRYICIPHEVAGMVGTITVE